MKSKIKEVIKSLEGNLIEHVVCDDNFYSCPASGANTFSEDDKCSCGADDYNFVLQENIDKLKSIINESN